jgi:DNA-binding transcriptional regulator YdaS (Cro superfamily)
MDKRLFSKITSSAGSQAALAAALGVGPMAVQGWKKRGIPAEWVLKVEAVTGVSRHDIRPDLYPLDGKYGSAQ